MATKNAVVVRLEMDPGAEAQSNELTKRGAQTLKLAEAFVIENPQDFEMAGNELAKIGKSIDAIDAHRKDITRPIDRAKAEIMDKFKPCLALLSDAKQIINRKMLSWRDDQERKRRAEQQKLEDDARKERERLEAEAKKLAKKNPEKAQEMREQAAQTVAPVVSGATVPAVKGVAVRKAWRAEVVDVKALCAAVAAGTVPTIAVEGNMVFLNEQARSLEEHFNIPGCRATVAENFGRVRG